MESGSHPDFALRPASAADQKEIRRLIRSERLNPIGLHWHNFTMGVDAKGAVIGCGQLKPHRNDTLELASIYVLPSWRGRGVARAIIESLLANCDSPVWLTCASPLTAFYARFGFQELSSPSGLPVYLRVAFYLSSLIRAMLPSSTYLALMRQSTRLPSRPPV